MTRANQEDLRGLDNSLFQAERALKHAEIHLVDARMMVTDEHYRLGLTQSDRMELKRLLESLSESIATVISTGNQTRPILDRAE